MIKGLSKKVSFVLAIFGAAIVGGASTALVKAAIPSSSDGQIHACYLSDSDPSGSLRVIDSEDSQTCTAEETALSWTQKGNPLLPDVEGADFTNAAMSYWNVRGLNFSHANFTGAVLRGTDFSGANLTNTVFGSLIANKANFTNADLSNASFGMEAYDANFTGVVFTNANLTAGDYLDGSNFTDADISNQHVINWTAQHAVFDNTNFNNTLIQNSNLTGSDLSTANLSGATWLTVICPDGTNSDTNGDTCIGHLVP